MSHLGVPPQASSRIQIKYYQAGDMMYVHPASRQKIKSDIDAFGDATPR